jgi:glycosyltransferase involved in cell wall biosynthesis
MSRPKISAIVTSFNEVDQIEECIASLLWADEVLLVDSFSTDGTVELVRSKFPQVIVEQRTYYGSAAQKNYGIDRVSNDWILIADSDERVPPELRDEIFRVLENPKYWAYAIYRRNFILGKEVRYSGLQRDRVTRLLHRKHARYPNRRVHTDLAVDGDIGKLKQKFLHNYVRSLDHMSEKMTRYGVWGGTQLFLNGQRSKPAEIFTHAFARFIRDYFGNLGILDGARGLIVVGLHVWYTFWKYSKLWEYTELERLGRPVPLVEIEPEAERWVMPWEKDPTS